MKEFCHNCLSCLYYGTETKATTKERGGNIMGALVDDRTEQERKTHCLIVVGTDSFLSGWGEASGGMSYAGWACKPGDLNKVESWVRSRSDMKRVRIVGNDYKPRAAHTHIYVVHENHRALD